MIRKYFAKRLQKFSLYMLIPTLIVFLVTFILSYQSTNRAIQDQGRRTVETVQTNLELVVSNVLTQNNLLSNVTRISGALRRALAGTPLSYSDSVSLNSLISVLSSVDASHEYVDSIYFYLDEYDRYFSSKTGLGNLSSSSDDSWVKIYQEMGEDRDSLVVTRDSNRFIEGMQTLSIFKRLLLQKGCMVVNINIDRFKEMLSYMNAKNHETIYLLNEQGEILLWESEEQEQPEIRQAFFEECMKKNGGEIGAALQACDRKWITWGGKHYLFNTRRYDELDLHVVSVISQEERTARNADLLQTYAMLLLANCVVIVVISYIITKRTFEQIKYMIDVFDNAEKGVFPDYAAPKVKDEYSAIMNNVLHLFVNTTYLNTQLKEKKYHQEVTELKALQLQINPHFLYNTLQSLDMEVQKVEGVGNTVSRMIQNVSDILKYSLGDEQASVSVEQEISYLKKYVEIQKFRFGDSFIIYYEVDEAVRTARVFKLMLQPLVENSILHGIRNLDYKGYIKIKIFARNGELWCAVVDNGRGMGKQEIQDLYAHIRDEKSRSIGLTNVNRRLVLKYGEESALRIQAKPGMGACISFRIPLENDPESE